MFRSYVTVEQSKISEGLLAELIEEITTKIESGQQVDVAEYEAQYPELAGQLQRLIPALKALGDLGVSTASSLHPFEESKAHDPTGQLGDFRILHEIGRGGMGVVYEAEQISIGRRVALKVLPFAAMLDKQQLNRFKNEARAAGTLDHPNIVAVHAVGTERGVHYYAMQLVEGQSLAEMIEQLRKPKVGDQRSEVREKETEDSAAKSEIIHYQSEIETKPVAKLSTAPNFDTQEYFRTVAQLGIQAAEALDHAHQNGIVHRDVKPGNLLVDAGGKLYVTDFGLARIEADAGMTMSGDLLGTLRYMSPEQALAKRVVIDHRTDIYSLGVTFYELLTLQAPYSGNDRQELLKRIAFEEPRRLRQINRKIPVDLETIVAKAMEKNPGDRYATAHVLAEDLHCFTSDQPIKARPPTALQRISKWSRRHVAAVRATAVCLAFIFIVVVWLVASQLSQLRAVVAAVESNLLQTRESLAVEELALAQVAIDQAQQQVDQIGDPSELQKQIDTLQQELARYKEFSVYFENARRMRGGFARENAINALDVYRVLDDTNWKEPIQNSTAPAEHEKRVAEQVYELLIMLANQELCVTHARSKEEQLQDIGEAQEFLSKALTVRAPTKGYYWELANCSQFLGDLTEGEVRTHHDTEALRLRALAATTPPQNAAELFYISRDRRWGCASDKVRPAFRQPYGEGEVLAAYRDMLRLDPHYYNALFYAGLQYVKEENREAAIQAFSGCLAIRPRDVIALGNRAANLADLGRHQESVADARRAVAIARDLVAENPEMFQARSKLAGVLTQLGYSNYWAGDIEGARTVWREVVALADRLIEENPSAGDHKRAALLDILADLDAELAESKEVPVSNSVTDTEHTEIEETRAIDDE